MVTTDDRRLQNISYEIIIRGNTRDTVLGGGFRWHFTHPTITERQWRVEIQNAKENIRNELNNMGPNARQKAEEYLKN
jgi:hypothetical protein